jgi:hypothetical protein
MPLPSAVANVIATPKKRNGTKSTVVGSMFVPVKMRCRAIW